MKLTNIGTDIIKVNESNYSSEKYQKIKRVHLIKLDFLNPNTEIVNQILYLFPKTNRFVVENNVKEYNYILKNTEKKYYVMNSINSNIISFLRKNNKILFNFINLSKEERDFFLMNGVFDDILRNTEVIAINKDIYDEKMNIIDKYKGNVILLDNKENI